MKAISLWQPWASAIAVGAKRIETRGWYTGFRGPLAIHAAKRMVKAEMIDFACSWNWRAAMEPLCGRMADGRWWWDILPFGAIVATCRLVDCRPTGSFTGSELDTVRFPKRDPRPEGVTGWTERQMGDFHLGRWGWVLEDITPLMEPLPLKGMQGLFDVPDAMLESHEERGNGA